VIEKIRRGVAERFLKLLNVALIYYLYKQKCSASEEINGSYHVFANSRWAILADGRYLDISQLLSYIL
jgi:hypothetical protein